MAARNSKKNQPNKLQRAFKEAFAGFDINHIDFNESGRWPIGVKIIASLIVTMLVVVLAYFLLLKDMDTQYEQLLNEEPVLKQTLTEKAKLVAGMDAHQQQLEQIRAMFNELAQQLPRKQEVPGLLEQMTRLGQQSGLVFRQIELETEQQTEFYRILPIRIVVTGTYHAMGEFIYGLAALPRIVTTHDFQLKPEEGALQLNIQARTYRYDDEEANP
ncbi:type 4a pilus biogenesis protein PilO [Balneatrix alpica]|uniref:Type 4a pilus biogenesis protein PilO n=1 Tax=Balneatrix alpica TaxID=75684 RepID=A0ABV5ZAU2_9GAMM|nr:type 4a pilus biogenesis protein PilO [Balneatrix alpica]